MGIRKSRAVGSSKYWAVPAIVMVVIAALSLAMLPGPSNWRDDGHWNTFGWWGWSAEVRSGLAASVLGGLIVAVSVLLAERRATQAADDREKEARGIACRAVADEATAIIMATVREVTEPLTWAAVHLKATDEQQAMIGAHVCILTKICNEEAQAVDMAARSSWTLARLAWLNEPKTIILVEADLAEWIRKTAESFDRCSRDLERVAAALIQFGEVERWSLLVRVASSMSQGKTKLRDQMRSYLLREEEGTESSMAGAEAAAVDEEKRMLDDYGTLLSDFSEFVGTFHEPIRNWCLWRGPGKQRSGSNEPFDAALRIKSWGDDCRREVEIQRSMEDAQRRTTRETGTAERSSGSVASLFDGPLE